MGVDSKKERCNILIGDKGMSESKRPKPTDIIIYTILKLQGTHSVAVIIGMVLSWPDKDHLRISTIPGEETREIKWSPSLPNLRIITQDEIGKAISSVTK